MHVDIAELMGAEIYAHCTCDGTSVTVRTPSGEPIHAGDTITAAVDMSRIHLFDKQTDARSRSDRRKICVRPSYLKEGPALPRMHRKKPAPHGSERPLRGSSGSSSS